MRRLYWLWIATKEKNFFAEFWYNIKDNWKKGFSNSLAEGIVSIPVFLYVVVMMVLIAPPLWLWERWKDSAKYLKAEKMIQKYGFCNWSEMASKEYSETGTTRGIPDQSDFWFVKKVLNEEAQ